MVSLVTREHDAMPDNLRMYISEIEKARQEINRVQGKQLHSNKDRDILRKLVEKYFNDVRPTVLADKEQNDDVNKIDGQMQALLVLCHKHGSVKRYKQVLTAVRKDLIKVDAQVVSSSVFKAQVPALDATDSKIIGTLQALLPSAALSYQQALIDLRTEARLSWRGPATDLREALRETLDHLAPDAEVEAMPGYKRNPDTTGPTMKHKVRFIMRKRGVVKALAEPTELAADSIDEAMGSFVRSVYTRSNVSTHTPTNKDEVLRVRDFVKIVLCELLEIHVRQ